MEAGAGSRWRGNNLKYINYEFRKEFFSVMVLRPWHTVPREAVAAPPWKCPKPGLDQPETVEGVTAQDRGLEWDWL